MTQIAAREFENNLDHILAEISLVELRLSREVQLRRQRGGGGLEDEFRGLLVSEDHIDAVMRHRVEQETGADPLLSLIQDRQAELSGRKLESLQRGSFRLERLADFYHLDSLEIGVITLCLAPELDRKYDAIYAFLQDDMGKRCPTVDLALQVFCPNLSERVAKRASFIYPSPLVKHGLVNVTEGPYGKDSSFLACNLRLDPRIADYLLGSDALDSRLQSTAVLVQPDTSWEEVVLPPETRTQLEQLAKDMQAASDWSTGILLQLVGPAGIGKKTVAKAMCCDLGKRLLTVDCAILLSSEHTASSVVTAACREALLQDAILYWENCHLILGDEPQHRVAQAVLAKEFGDGQGLAIIAGEIPWLAPAGLDNRALLTVELPRPEFDQRNRLWESHLNGNRSCVTTEELASLAGKFKLNGGQIRRAVATARDLAMWRSWSDAQITVADLGAAARWHSSQGLAHLARKIQTRYSWDDIVLPNDQKAQLREICGYLENMAVVYGQWEFQGKTSLGKGLTILFAGLSGTGKTMASEIMAGEIGLDLYKIDLSSIVSKYIGETEKNLDRIFREAEDSNAILFFDEADAVFGKRSEVRDSHDRYANIEISYLLQKMEEYQGIVILATNFRRNMDDAFVRRLQFAVEFPFPDEEHRLQIWQRVFPPKAPIEENVDLHFLARQLKVAGGNIKNIAVAAAFLAAQESKSIGMEHVMWATKREYQKMGKLLVDSDFGPYFELVKG